MIFAAGFGTRMKHLTRSRPKPLIMVDGQPLIDHALSLADAIDPVRVIVNLHYLADLLEAHLSQRGVTTVREEPRILDTGGGLRNALPALMSDPVITMNSDAVWAGPNPLRLLIEAWDPTRMDALLICVPLEQAHGRDGDGDFRILQDGQLSRGGDTVYGGIQMMKTAALHDVPDPVFSLNVVWNMMAQRGRLHGLTYPGHWADVGHPGGIEIAEEMLKLHHV